MPQIYLGYLKSEDESKDEALVVEKYISGKYEKYINNTGINQSNCDATRLEKAECLAHFSYHWSENKLLLVDIQGAGYTLYDPEIATSVDESEVDGEARFTMGNLRGEAIKKFVDGHLCNDYCRMLGLELI